MVFVADGVDGHVSIHAPREGCDHDPKDAAR